MITAGIIRSSTEVAEETIDVLCAEVLAIIRERCPDGTQWSSTKELNEYIPETVPFLKKIKRLISQKQGNYKEELVQRGILLPHETLALKSQKTAATRPKMSYPQLARMF